MRKINFTVDSALLKELGERLVGRPHIALAELIKNSYDADATTVVVSFHDDEIEIGDDGSGMDFEAFRDFWMRVGSHHKEARGISPKFERPLTGSKGVGRLAVQFLAQKLSIRTSSDAAPDQEIYAEVDWSTAVQAGDLTSAYARYETRARVEAHAGSPHGTTIRLSQLNHAWEAKAFEDLAREIWFLRPPFHGPGQGRHGAFEVRLETPERDVLRRFEDQMAAVMDLWEAQIRGRMEPTDDPRPGRRSISLMVDFADDRSRKRVTYRLPDCHLNGVDFEIRVFKLQNRQAKGVRVEDARKYLLDFGGVHIYDSGFHLPYYGPETDWLRVEIDHSHRLSRSRLLPEEYQVAEGLNYLPTNSRLYGVVNVNTGREHALAASVGLDHVGQFLTIQVSRDRLVDNIAFQELQTIVRWALDYYAMREAARALERAERRKGVETVATRTSRIEEILEQNRDFMPRSTYQNLRTEVRAIATSAEAIEDVASRQAGLLGALATAGMSALAYEHEVTKQVALLEATVTRLSALETGSVAADLELRQITENLDAWIQRARRTRRLFSSLLELTEQPKRQSLRAKNALAAISDQVEPLLRGVTIELAGVDPSLRLPPGMMAEWTALFQNLFVNSANAMIDSKSRRLVVSSTTGRGRGALVVADTGVGVELESSEELFRPFVRRLRISSERRALGLGGTGLGLTIARMIASSLGCEIGFVPPASPFTTAVQVSWKEHEAR